MTNWNTCPAVEQVPGRVSGTCSKAKCTLSPE